MRTVLIFAMVAMILFTAVLFTATPATAYISCLWARYSPAFAVACFMQIMMDLWDPLLWGDGPSGSAAPSDGDTVGSR